MQFAYSRATPCTCKTGITFEAVNVQTRGWTAQAKHPASSASKDGANAGADHWIGGQWAGQVVHQVKGWASVSTLHGAKP